MRIAIALASKLIALRTAWRRRVGAQTVGVRVQLLDSDGKVLLIRHRYGDQAWYLPGGRVGRREDPRDAAVRELREETGVHLAPGQLTATSTLRADKGRWRDTVHVFEGRLDGRVAIRKPSLEVAELAWHDPAAPPTPLNGGTGRRLAELLGVREPDGTW